MRSLPPRPLTRSFPPSATITSARFVPTIVFARALPTIVALAGLDSAALRSRPGSPRGAQGNTHTRRPVVDSAPQMQTAKEPTLRSKTDPAVEERSGYRTLLLCLSRWAAEGRRVPGAGSASVPTVGVCPRIERAHATTGRVGPFRECHSVVDSQNARASVIVVVAHGKLDPADVAPGQACQPLRSARHGSCHDLLLLWSAVGSWARRRARSPTLRGRLRRRHGRRPERGRRLRLAFRRLVGRLRWRPRVRCQHERRQERGRDLQPGRGGPGHLPRS